MTLVRFHVIRKDNAAPIQGAEVIFDYQARVMTTDAAGYTVGSDFPPGSYNYVVRAGGYTSESQHMDVTPGATIDITIQMSAATIPGAPAQEGEVYLGPVGTSCDIVMKRMFDRDWYAFRNRYSGQMSSWYTTKQDVDYFGPKAAICLQTPPPPPKTVDDVQKDVDILRGTLQGLSSALESLRTAQDAIWKEIADFKASMYAWLVEHVYEALMQVLNTEAKKRINR